MQCLVGARHAVPLPAIERCVHRCLSLSKAPA